MPPAPLPPRNLVDGRWVSRGWTEHDLDPLCTPPASLVARDVPGEHRAAAEEYVEALLHMERLRRDDPVSIDPATGEALSSYFAVEKLVAADPDLHVSAQRLAADACGDYRAAIAADAAGVPVAELNARIMSGLRTFVDSSDLSISVGSEDVLNSILDNGRFKTEFDLLDASAKRCADYGDSRRAAEKEWFGIDEGAADGRPVYAAYTTPAVSPEYAVTSAYGDILIVLKSGVRERSTMTIGDSLNAHSYNIRPFTLDEDNPFVGVRADYVKELARVNVGKGHFTAIEYIEAQVHGGVTVDDIEAVRIPEWMEVTQQTIDRIAAAGIRLDFDGSAF